MGAIPGPGVPAPGATRLTGGFFQTMGIRRKGIYASRNGDKFGVQVFGFFWSLGLDCRCGQFGPREGVVQCEE